MMVFNIKQFTERLTTFFIIFQLIIFLPACGSEDNEMLTGDKVGIVEERQIVVEEQTLLEVPAELSIKKYEHIFNHSNDPELKNRILRRMADLSLVATEEKFSLLDKDQTPAEIQQQTENNIENYKRAIRFYKKFLETSPNTNFRAEAYYNLARAYELLGETELTMEMLNTLVTEHPNSSYYQEAQFRRGEILFSFGDYAASSDAYRQVVSRTNDERFFEQALYKYAWSQYKSYDYDMSIVTFFQLIDLIILKSGDIPPDLNENKLILDSKRAISLAFSHLDGAKSVRKYFKDNGRKNYEINVYDALAQHYLRQERYKDAADTYQTIVDTHPLHPKAFVYQIAVIETYIKGGFPSLVLPAKEEFVERFGIRSPFWAYYKEGADKGIVSDEAVLDNIKVKLKTHVNDITSHYHAIAQKTGLTEDYLITVSWYRESMATFIDEPEARNINQLLAETLFDAQNYAQAIVEFDHTINDYPGTPEDNANTAYFGLVAYQKILENFKGEDVERDTWTAKKILAQQIFSDNYPFHSEIANVHNSTLEDQLNINDLLGAIETAEKITNIESSPIPLQKKAWITIANGEFDLKNYPDAEIAYVKVLEFKGHSASDLLKFNNQLAISIYKQAEGLQKAGFKEKAAQQFLLVGKKVPNSPIRATAEFDAAILFLETSSWKEAITVLTQFRKLYPDHKLAETIPDKLATAYEATGNWSAASKELQLIVNSNFESNSELSRQALWHAAELQEKVGNKHETIKLYKKYAHAFNKPLELRAEAEYRLSNLYLELGELEKQAFWLQKLLGNYKREGSNNTDRSLYLAAFAAFELSKSPFSEFQNIPLTLPLKTSLKRKKKALQSSLNYYATTIEIGVADFTTAATFKTGELYRILATDLMNSQKPTKLNELELEQYEILLEEQALPFEDSAIEIYEQNTQLVLQMIYDDWVRKSFASLSKLVPGRYDKNERIESYANEIR